MSDPITVTTQAELDAALAAKADRIWIQSPKGLWLTVRDSDSSSVVAWGSSSVVARGSSSVVARGSSSVEARDSSSVVARGSSSVVAWGSSSVVAWGSSSVVAWGSSSVVAWGSSSVEARDSSSVVAWDSSSVVAWGSSSVEARDSSSVEARDSSSVEARDSSSVVAWGKFAVARHLSKYATVTGSGVVLDQREPVVRTVDEWCDEFGVARDGDRVTLFKAVGAEFEAGEAYTRTSYVPGTEVVAPDFEADGRCGHGLHVGPSVSCATYYRTHAQRWVEVSADVADLDVINESSGAPKVKARAVLVVREVDRRGRPVVAS